MCLVPLDVKPREGRGGLQPAAPPQPSPGAALPLERSHLNPTGHETSSLYEGRLI